MSRGYLHSLTPPAPHPSPHPPFLKHLPAVFTLITPPAVLEKSSIFAFSLWLPTPALRLMKLSSPSPQLLLFLSCPLSLSLPSHMHLWLDPAPQVRNDDEKMRGNQQRFAMLGCTQLCFRVSENSLHGGRLELLSHLCPTA